MEKRSFEYTYSARRQQEVEAIRSAYLPRQEDPLESLRRRHAIPTRKAQAAALTVGILGALLLGFGMSLCMTELGASWGPMAFVIGIPVGLAGIALAARAWPVYTRVLKRERERIAPEILRLTDELI